MYIGLTYVEIQGAEVLTLVGGRCCVCFTNPVLVVALQVGGVSDETVNYGYEFWATGAIVNTLQIADLSSRQRGLPTDTGPQISDSNISTGNNIWSQVP
jgi:hypothetical protein